MPRPLRSVVLGTRTSRETKIRFAALAAQQGITASTLLARLVDHVLATNTTSDATSPAQRTGDERCARDRLSLRLRPGDRVLAERRAAARGMKTGSYLTMLVHNHLRGGVPVMAPPELNQLKVTTGQLAALGRQLRMFGVPNTAITTGDPGLAALLMNLQSEVERVREGSAAVIRQNLIGWEAGNA